MPVTDEPGQAASLLPECRSPWKRRCICAVASARCPSRVRRIAARMSADIRRNPRGCCQWHAGRFAHRTDIRKVSWLSRSNQKTKRAALYLRVSTGEQTGRQGHIRRQRTRRTAAARRHAKGRGSSEVRCGHGVGRGSPRPLPPRPDRLHSGATRGQGRPVHSPARPSLEATTPGGRAMLWPASSATARCSAPCGGYTCSVSVDQAPTNGQQSTSASGRLTCEADQTIAFCRHADYCVLFRMKASNTLAGPREQ